MAWRPVKTKVRLRQQVTRPRMKPCPYCKSAEGMCIMNYDGWRHVECHACSFGYMGPGCGSMVQAVRAHNELVVQPNVIEGAARLVETMTGRLSASAPSEENT